MNIAIVLSGGTGTRMGGDIPKQYIEVGGKPVISYCLKTLQVNENIDNLVIVAEANWQEFIIENCNLDVAKFKGFVLPGENRQLSIYNALEYLSDFATDNDLVFIHDAARPCLSKNMIDRCFEALNGVDGVIPVLPMKDTVYLSDEAGNISSLLDRSKVVAGQAPELFIFGKYFEANRTLAENGEIYSINGSTEPAILAGMKIKTILGDEKNFKITTPEDLRNFRNIIDVKY